MKHYKSYYHLRKPRIAPPAWVFGPVWTILYSMMAVSFGWVAYQVMQTGAPLLILLPFALNLVFNGLFTPIQFGIKSHFWALVDEFFVLVTLIWIMISIFPFAPWVTYFQIPYLIWVLFATWLQVDIMMMN